MSRLLLLPWATFSRWTICICIVYIMVRPVGYNVILVPIIGLLGAVSLLTVVYRRQFPSREILLPIGGVVLVGLYGAGIGISNPGLVNGALVWIVAPGIFGAWAAAGDERLVKMVFFASAIVTIIISVGIIIYVAGSVGAIPQLFSRFVLEQNGAGFDSDAGGTTNITFFGLSTLVAAAPMWVAALILPGHPLLPNKVITIIAAVTGVAATLLAGRAAITVLLVIIPVVIWVAWRLITRGAPRRPWRNWTPLVAAVAAIGVVVILSALGNTSVERALNRVATVFTGQGQSLDDRIRSVEATKLLQAWTQSPIFGHGLGATIPGYSRSDTRPWNFELQYHLALFQFGLVGALVLVVAFAVAVYGVVRALRAQPGLLPAVLVAIGGAASMLIANGINPYLQAPGNMWPVYFVLMIINVVLAPALSARKGQE